MMDTVSTGAVIRAAVTADVLSVDRVLAAVVTPGTGGIALFVGVVRDHDHGEPVSSLDYTAHPLAESRLRESAERVAAMHAVATVAVEHRVGHLVVGDLAVVVGVGAAHRGPALAACAALIDDLKASVPIWKQQYSVDGATEWVGLG